MRRRYSGRQSPEEASSRRGERDVTAARSSDWGRYRRQRVKNRICGAGLDVGIVLLLSSLVVYAISAVMRRVEQLDPSGGLNRRSFYVETPAVGTPGVPSCSWDPRGIP